jgi:hypothetical protein
MQTCSVAVVRTCGCRLSTYPPHHLDPLGYSAPDIPCVFWRMPDRWRSVKIAQNAVDRQHLLSDARKEMQ